jgi:hypothetical protein
MEKLLLYAVHLSCSQVLDDCLIYPFFSIDEIYFAKFLFGIEIVEFVCRFEAENVRDIYLRERLVLKVSALQPQGSCQNY